MVALDLPVGTDRRRLAAIGLHAPGVHVLARVAVLAVALQEVLADDPVCVAVQEVVNDLVIILKILRHGIESLVAADLQLGAKLARNRIVREDDHFVGLSLWQLLVVLNLRRVIHSILPVVRHQLACKVLNKAKILLAKLLLNVWVLRELIEHVGERAWILLELAQESISACHWIGSPVHLPTHWVEVLTWVKVWTRLEATTPKLVREVPKAHLVILISILLLLFYPLLFLLFLDGGRLKLLHHRSKVLWFLFLLFGLRLWRVCLVWSSLL